MSKKVKIPRKIKSEKSRKMLEFYPNLNINSGMLQDQTDNVLNTSLECGRPGKKITFQMKNRKTTIFLWFVLKKVVVGKFMEKFPETNEYKLKIY